MMTHQLNFKGRKLVFKFYSLLCLHIGPTAGVQPGRGELPPGGQGLVHSKAVDGEKRTLGAIRKAGRELHLGQLLLPFESQPGQVAQSERRRSAPRVAFRSSRTILFLSFPV